jgi:putative hydrolase of the HAD superfamily
MGHGAVTGIAAGQPLRAIVFDLDGTLYQDERLGEEVHQCACRYVASLQGISASEAAGLLRRARSCTMEGEGTLSLGVVSLGGNLKELHRRFNLEVHPEGVLHPDPRVLGLLGKLAGRFELHIYTNNNRPLSGRIMAELGIAGSFQRVFTIEDSWHPKPDRSTLQMILDTIGREPSETLFVGDRYQVDLQLPATLGCAVFEVRNVEDLLTLGELVGEGAH